MSRLMPMELRAGRRARIDDTLYVIRKVDTRTPYIDVSREGEETVTQVSRSELAALIVEERATLLDEPEDPEPVPRRAVTDITNLKVTRVIDWFAKMYVVRGMIHEKGCPKSSSYRKAFEARLAEVTLHLEACGISRFPGWSVHTVYHDVLRLRSAGYDLAALQVKGVEYVPLTPGHTSELFDDLRSQLEELVLENPTWSKANLHRELNKTLATNFARRGPEARQAETQDA